MAKRSSVAARRRENGERLDDPEVGLVGPELVGVVPEVGGVPVGVDTGGEEGMGAAKGVGGEGGVLAGRKVTWTQ